MLNTFSDIIINLSAIRDNYLELKQKLKPGSCCSVVLKNDAYGLGASKIANTLYDVGCRDFWVAYIGEAIDLRNAIPNDTNIYFLQGIEEQYIQYIKNYAIVPVVNSVEDFQIVRQKNIELVLHIDSGLTRLGLRDNELNQILEQLPNERIKYVISHLGCADETDNILNYEQRQRFNESIQKIKQYKPDIKKGISASSGVFLGTEYHYDITRCGAYIYGINANEHSPKNVLSLRSRVLQKYEIPAGTHIGYGATCCVNRLTKIAVISIGYADGINRSLSNKGVVLFYEGNKQYKAKILGAISMDLLVCDVSNIPDELTSPHKMAYMLDDNYTINHMGIDAGVIPYEILTSINFKSGRFKITYID